MSTPSEYPPYTPNKLTSFSQYAATAEESAALIASANVKFQRLMDEYAQHQKTSIEYADILIHAIAHGSPLFIRYRNRPGDEVVERLIIPAAFYQKHTIPGPTQWSGDTRPIGTLPGSYSSTLNWMRIKFLVRMILIQKQVSDSGRSICVILRALSKQKFL